MSLPEKAVKYSTVTYFVTFLVVVAGILSFNILGKLEDPEYTVKQAAVVTTYPGASPKEVELEVTERIEIALQELEQIDYLRSDSRAGVSTIDVYIKPHYKTRQLPQIFDEVRRKVVDVAPSLPPGANEPSVIDDVGDVFGFLLAITGDGFSEAELEEYVKGIRRELSLVAGVGRVDPWGIQEKVIYVDISQSKLSQLGISPQNIYGTLANQNVVLYGGGIDINPERFRIEIKGAFQSPEEIANLSIRAKPVEMLGQQKSADRSELVSLGDIATIRRGYREPPRMLMRHNMENSIALAIAGTSGGNVVDMGHALDKRIKELLVDLPVGIEIHKIAWQSDLVTESINGFMVSLVQAVLIVLVVLWLAMGWANAVIIGAALVLTILATFVAMAILDIPLQRMSLGALVIALGMMVDNAIVVADGATVRMQKGMDKIRAVIEAASETAWPLLGATVIAVGFFLPIYLSTESTGEYCASLFEVVAISLLFSWVISMTVTPLQCAAMIKVNTEGGDEDVYGGLLYKKFKGLLRFCIGKKTLTLGMVFGIFIISCLAFQFVPQLFFPDSSRLQFMVDYWAPEGTRIEQVSEDLVGLEKVISEDDRIDSVSAFIGAGPPRFYLPVEPEKPYQSYAQLIVNTKDFPGLLTATAELEKKFSGGFPEALIRIRRFAVGPGNSFKFEARFSGPGTVDPSELREIASEATDILKASPFAKDIRTDWRQRTKKIVAEYYQARGRWSEISRNDLARATQRAHDGALAGLYRERDDLWPIIMRAQEDERRDINSLDTTPVIPQMSSNSAPLSQVASLEVQWEDPIIWRRDRRRTITVQSEPDGVTLSQLRADVVPAFNALELPPGYTMEWGSEYEDTVDSQAALVPGTVPVVIVVSLILVILFNSYAQLGIISCLLPLTAIGVSLSLLVTQAPFGFMSLLGAMSLIGMMIKNAIVLLDQVNIELEQGFSRYQAVVNAAVSRLRPVILAAATTILGVIPLLPDVFWNAMAIVIMGGLAVGTILTMVIVPVLYCSFFRVSVPEEDS